MNCSMKLIADYEFCNLICEKLHINLKLQLTDCDNVDNIQLQQLQLVFTKLKILITQTISININIIMKLPKSFS